MKDIKSVGILIGLFTMVFGCSHVQTAESGVPDIRGNISRIRWADLNKGEKGIIGFVLVEGDLEEDTKFDKALITVTDKTAIYKQIGSDRHPVAFEKLDSGQKVEARFTGPVMHSYPARATAIEIVILRAEGTSR